MKLRIKNTKKGWIVEYKKIYLKLFGFELSK